MVRIDVTPRRVFMQSHLRKKTLLAYKQGWLDIGARGVDWVLDLAQVHVEVYVALKPIAA